jgi:hypothetical protein
MNRDRSPSRNQRGQAAIFVALMFNVLFVFFAMALNVALVVHDKVNLQNSVDMAAYYAAAKQAEILDVIAHENYMIRQSWKLLSWRYRVLGTMGIYQAPSPPSPVWTGDISDQIYPPAFTAPSLCVSYRPTWTQAPINENLCNRENLQIPQLPSVSIIAGFLGMNAGIAALSQQLRMQFTFECSKLGAMNWWFAMSIMHAFRLDQRNRKQVILALAQNLSNAGSTGDFIDLDGNSVLQGAKNTFTKNLTFANKQAFKDSDFQMFNSLSGVDVGKWLVEIQIVPTMLYTDTQETNGENCNTYAQVISNLPARQQAVQQLAQPFPQGWQAQDLMQWAKDEAGFLQGSDYQYSIGYEKNPWYMAYMGVKANTTPRQIFFPFGSGVAMSARAFAKPFGGRIGPWYKSTWQQGQPTSDGTLTDLLMAPRMISGGGSAIDPQDPHRLPNYSRFPGDTMGMASNLSQNALMNMSKLGSDYDFYKNIKADFTQGGANDILAWDLTQNKAPDIRNYEISILSPDLFDITYYSIEPKFIENYLTKLTTNAAALGIPSDTPLRPDLGFSVVQKTFDVKDQMAVQTTMPLQRPDAYFFVRSKANLLTAWLPAPGAFSYDATAASANFGKCALPDDGLKYPNPGACVAGGGRTGYSVKIISRDALLSSGHLIGGTGVGAGPISNPPTW